MPSEAAPLPVPAPNLGPAASAPGSGSASGPDTTHPGGFSDAAADRLRAAQAAMTDLLAVAGLSGVRPMDLGRRLGLDKTLAWKVARFVEEPDPLRAAKHVPGAGGVQILLQAAAEHGVAADHVEAVREADRLLREFVRHHAGDRRSFEAMLARGGRDARVESEERREFFRAGSVVWGVRAQAQVLALVLRPSETEDGMLDVVQVGGLVGLERLRPDLPWIVRRLRVSDDTEREGQPVRRRPLAPESVTPGGMPLLPRFCSEPTPELRRFEDDAGFAYDELVPGPVGRRGLVTCISGERYDAAIPFRRSEQNTVARYRLIVRTPIQHALFDIYLHESLRHWGEATARVDAILEDRPRTEARSGAAAPLYGPRPAASLGSPPKVQTPRSDAHGELVRWAIERAGWGPLDLYRGYRAEIEYPPPPCEIEIACPIGETE